MSEVSQSGNNSVALLVSAWIEIKKRMGRYTRKPVALLVSAWIEIVINYTNPIPAYCRTPRECVD